MTTDESKTSSPYMIFLNSPEVKTLEETYPRHLQECPFLLSQEAAFKIMDSGLTPPVRAIDTRLRSSTPRSHHYLLGGLHYG